MFHRLLTKGIEALVVLCTSVMTAIVFIEVFLRYLFGSTLYITEELSRYLMVWIVFLAASLALKDDAHINVGMLVKKFPGWSRSWMNLTAQILLLIFLGFLLVEGVIVLPYQAEQITPSLGVPIFWFYLAIPVGSSCMILFLLSKMWQTILEILDRVPAQTSRHAGPPAGGAV